MRERAREGGKERWRRRESKDLLRFMFYGGLDKLKRVKVVESRFRLPDAWHLWVLSKYLLGVLTSECDKESHR